MDLKRYIKPASFMMTLIIILSSQTRVTYASIWDPFHTKEEKIELWKTLWDTTQGTEYHSIGKTVKGNEILAFKAGNPLGGILVLDGEMHGNEDKGSEVLYLLACWLLKSGEPRAQEIMTRNYVIFVPVLNYDRHARGNANHNISEYGVDLNRNFGGGWQKISPESDTYSGPHPYSEPETRALRDLLSQYRPSFYVNIHVGAGPFLAYHRDGNTSLAWEVITDMRLEANNLGVTPFRAHGIGSQGYSISEATKVGASGWVLEMVGAETAWRHTDEIYQDLIDVYLPKVKAMFLAMTSYCMIESRPAADLDGDWDIDFNDLITFVGAYHQYKADTTVSGKADLDLDTDIDLDDFRMIMRAYQRAQRHIYGLT